MGQPRGFKVKKQRVGKWGLEKEVIYDFNSKIPHTERIDFLKN